MKMKILVLSINCQNNADTTYVRSQKIVYGSQKNCVRSQKKLCTAHKKKLCTAYKKTVYAHKKTVYGPSTLHALDAPSTPTSNRQDVQDVLTPIGRHVGCWP